MLPILFRIPIPGTDLVIPIRTFGLMAALAFLLGLWVVLREGKRQKLDPDKLQSVALWVFVGILAGGRLGFVLVNFGEFAKEPLRAFKIWEGGLVLYGGLISAMILGVIRLRMLRLPALRTADLFLMGGLLGLSLARVG
jgi:phosphatidylglycerol:prolipoprotein diacylglycerol transferase